MSYRKKVKIRRSVVFENKEEKEGAQQRNSCHNSSRTNHRSNQAESIESLARFLSELSPEHRWLELGGAPSSCRRNISASSPLSLPAKNR